MGSHFAGKSVKEHLKEARARGSIVSAEIHGVEMSGSMAAGADSAKEISLLLIIVGMALAPLLPQAQVLIYIALVSCGWVIWKTARSALLGWSRIERLHRLIEEERWEIEHHRQQEKLELRDLYEAKGFKGKLLDDAIEVLMADDNRLLRVMLEEELGLSLETYEHPLKQAWGAFLGALISASVSLLGLSLFQSYGLIGASFLSIVGSCILTARLDKNRIWHFVIWNLASIGLIVGILHFLIAIILKT